MSATSDEIAARCSSSMWRREAFEPQGVGQGGVRVQVGCHNLHLIHDFGPSRGYRLQGRKEIIVKAARSCRRDVLYLWYCRKASLDFSYISRAWRDPPDSRGGRPSFPAMRAMEISGGRSRKMTKSGNHTVWRPRCLASL